MAETKILHIKGNYIHIGFQLSEVDHRLVNGHNEVDNNDVNIRGDVWVVLRRGLLIRQYKTHASFNYVYFTDWGFLPCGEYDIEVYYEAEGEMHMRFCQEKVLIVVNSTAEGQVYQSTDYDVQAYYPVINGRESAVIIGDGFVRIMSGNGLLADIDSDSVNLRAGYGDSEVEVTENNVNININE